MNRFYSLETLCYEQDVTPQVSYQSYSFQDIRLSWVSNGENNEFNRIAGKNRKIEFVPLSGHGFERQMTPIAAISCCSEDAPKCGIAVCVDSGSVPVSFTGVDSMGDHQSPTEPVRAITDKFIASDHQQCYESSSGVEPLKDLCSLSLRRQASIKTQPQNATHDEYACDAAPPCPSPLLQSSVEDKVLLKCDTMEIFVTDSQILGGSSNGEKLVVNNMPKTCSPPDFSIVNNDRIFETVQPENPPNLNKENPCIEFSVLSMVDSEATGLLSLNNITEEKGHTPVGKVLFDQEKTEVTIKKDTETYSPLTSSPKITYDASETIQSESSSELNIQHPRDESTSILSVPGSETMVFDHNESLSEKSDDDYGLPGSRRRSHPSAESDSFSEDDSLYSDASHKSLSHYSDAADIDLNVTDSQPIQVPVTEELKRSGELCTALSETPEENAPESSDLVEELDADQDKTNPAYIPRTGTYFMHDYRSSENDEAASKSDSYKSRADRGVWQHDMFSYYEQGPRSSHELIKKYGYDIRNAESNSSSSAPTNDLHPPKSEPVVTHSDREPVTHTVADPPAHIDSHPQKHTDRSTEHEYSQFSNQARGDSYRKDIHYDPRQVNRAYTNVGHTRGRFTRSSGNSYQRQGGPYITTEHRHDQSQKHFTRSGSSGPSTYYRNSGNRGRGRGMHSSTFTTEQSTLHKDPLTFSDRRNNVVPETSDITGCVGSRNATFNGSRLRGRGAPPLSVSIQPDHRQGGTGPKRYSAFRQSTAASAGTAEAYAPHSHTSHVPNFPLRQAFADPNVGVRIVAQNFDDHYSEPPRSLSGNTCAPAFSGHFELHTKNRSQQYSDIRHFNSTQLVENPTYQQGVTSRLSSTFNNDNRVPSVYTNASSESYQKGRFDFAPVDGSSDVVRYTHTHDTSRFNSQEPRSARFREDSSTEGRPLLGRRPFKPLEIRNPRDQLSMTGEGTPVETRSNFGTENWFAT